MTSPLSGIVTPLLTPYENDLTIATDLYLGHAADCLAQGSHYLSPFGTTGEALSNSMRERMSVLEALISSGTASGAQLLPGTGLCSAEETLDLTRHAADLGVAAVMLLPPFFFKPVGDDGLFRYYAGLIEALGAQAPRIILYNIPQNTGVAISPTLAARLNTAFPEIVTAYKDSSGDWENTMVVMRAAPGITMFPSSETKLAEGLALGAGGCISASCNSNAQAIRAMYDAARARDEATVSALQPGLETHRLAVQKAGLINGLKSLRAHLSGDERWLNLRAPHCNADPAIGAALATTLV
jgi:4-hydroxy-tetrahydrodipicolinate synthase